MKKFLSVLLSIAMLVTLLPAMSVFATGFTGEAVVLEAEVLEGTDEAVDIAAGDTITVNINYASGFAYVTGAKITMTYDSEILTLVSQSAVIREDMRNGLVNAETAGTIIYTPNANNPVGISENKMIATAQFTVSADATEENLESVISFVVNDWTCFNDETHPELGTDTAWSSTEIPCSMENITLTINPAEVTDTPISEQPNKIYDLVSYTDEVKEENNAYQTEEEAVKTISYMAIGEGLTNSSYMKYNKAATYGPSADMVGASYIRTRRYYGNFPSVTVDSADMMADTLIQRRIYEADGTYTVASEAKSFGGGSDYTIRRFNTIDTKAYKPGETWFEFKVTSDCTVVIRDNSGFGYPSINPAYTPDSGWTKSNGTQATLGGTSYWKNFNAGDTVKIPAYGLAGKYADTRTVKYYYTNTEGEEVHVEGADTDVAHADFPGWESGNVVAVKWSHTLSSDATLKTLTVGGSEVALASGTYTYDVEFPSGTTSAAIVAEANDANATVADVADVDLTSGSGTATITVTAEDGTVQEYVVNITVTDKPFLNVAGAISSSRIYKAFGEDSVEGISISTSTKLTGFATADEAKAAVNEVVAAFNAVNGENAHLGTNGWDGYPKVTSSAASDGTYTGTFDQPNPLTKAFVDSMGKDVWVLALGKGHSFKNYPLTEADNLGFHGDIEDYITFETTKPGTVYVKLFKSVVVGGDWVAAPEIGSNIYAIHFDAGKVAIPGLHSTPESVTAAMNSAIDTRIQNGPILFFAFDDLSDATLEEITYEIGDASYTAAVEGDEIAIEVLPGVESVKITAAKGKLEATTIAPVEIAVADGSGTLVATAPDGTTKEYTVTVTAVEKYKIINPTSKGAAWLDGIYGTKELKKFGSKLVAIEGINSADAGTISAHSDRIDMEKLTLNDKFSDATIILNVRNGASPEQENITAYRYDETTQTWVSDEQASFTRQIEGEEAKIYTGTKYNAYGGGGKTGFRKIKTASLDKPLFAGDYADWITFIPTSDCTVILGDKINLGWPNLDKTLWKSGTAYTYLGNNSNTYTRHFKAGEVVSIPNYGIPDYAPYNDTRNVTYTYYDSTGAEQTVTMPVYYEYQNWMNIGVAIVWDDKAIVSDAEIMVDGTAIEATAGTAYEYVLENADDEVEVTAAADTVATVVGTGTYKAGDTATITVTAGDGVTVSTYTITFRAKRSDATLASAKAGDTDVVFDATNSAAIELAYGAEIPEITAVATDANATANVVVEGDVATITVTAEDGTTATYTITFTFADKLYALQVMGINGTVSATYADKTDEDWDALKTMQVATGSVFTLTAIADEGATFMYWLDVNSGRIVSYGDTYTVTVGTDKSLVAVFAIESQGYTVEFVDRNYKVYMADFSVNDITVPEDPYMLGYKFEGWEIDGVKQNYVAGQVIAANTFTAATKIKAIQTLEETTYKVNLVGANEEGSEYQYNKAITVTPAVPEGMIFSHWTRDGKIASYNETYMFYVANYETTVEAHFVADTETVAVMPTITMAEPTVVAGNKLSFIMERTVPEGYSVVETGILIQEGQITAEGEITLDNYKYKGISANLASYGAYTVRKGNVAVGEYWSAVGYLIYSDGTDTYTIYTKPVNGTVTE